MSNSEGPDWRTLRLSDYESAQRLYERTIGVLERIALLLISAHAIGVGVTVNAIIGGGVDINGAARDLIQIFMGGAVLGGGAVVGVAFMAQTHAIALMKHVGAEFQVKERRPFKPPMWGAGVGLVSVLCLVASMTCLVVVINKFLGGYPEGF